MRARRQLGLLFGDAVVSLFCIALLPGITAPLVGAERVVTAAVAVSGLFSMPVPVPPRMPWGAGPLSLFAFAPTFPP
eukprot:12916957-Prorocentrum_lima.AAC.1